ncbi:MAG: hypothetical protein HWQ43_29460 [Nostoc sp. JL31]|uniref:Uncharacterized protein n=1 Tax=Nostoc punctiforme NIES-2108 TaxID=1356359 RepID=A0A367R534_NOSPU|nr:hypothetical protein [Nostoc sp. JL31]MBN3893076.1 hypothetical protein [Nostoc sp. JL31]RCJ31525.1 hypothetical protein A6769_30220 [Nostoc punctiforme NIES-2108]
MPLKIVQNFDGSFTLEAQAQETLFNLLTGVTFLNQICQQLGCEGLKFTELLFQPVPYSLTTTKGMPAEFEKYHESDEYVIINVPPNFMFSAKIFKPSRLCAIFQKLSNE